MAGYFTGIAVKATMKLHRITAADLLSDENPLGPYAAITIGVFDGLHVGHLRIVETMREIAGNESVALVTFSTHPRAILSGRTPIRVLHPLLRNRILEAWGVDGVVELETNRELLGLDAPVFASGLQKRLLAREIVVGSNFGFGKGRQGGLETLRDYFESVTVVEPVEVEGLPASATRLREMLAKADLAGAEAMTGRRYTVLGSPEHGDGIGRTIGSPTLNLTPPPETLPDGVYAVATSAGRGVAHLGPRPTFDRVERRFEVHLLDGAATTRGDVAVEVTFVGRIREIRNFGCAEKLSEQIARDIAAARAMLQ
jgi:riboflavin kinase / FMN adenylyltransferase